MNAFFGATPFQGVKTFVEVAYESVPKTVLNREDRF